MNRKTTTILFAAGSLVAAAVALGSRSEGSQTKLPPGPIPHTPDVPPLADLCSTKDALPAHASADFGAGTMRAGLSSAKVIQAGNGEVYMAVDLDVADVAGAHRAPVNMAIVIDHSGSMSGDKIAQARQAARGIVERLGAEDRVALIQYDDDAQVLVPAIAADAEGKQRLFSAIERIQDDGGTNLHGGMMLGIGEARRAMGGERVNRVVLLSDGQANVGVVDPAQIARSASDSADQGVRVTTIGLGLDYNEDLMEAIAENGRGQYYYVKDAGSLESVFAGELRSMQGTVATRAELRLSPACSGVEIAEVYGYESRHEGNDVVVPLADLFGGEKRKVLVRLRVPAGVSGAKALARTTLAYDAAGGGGRKTAALDLGVEVSSDAQAVRASADADVMTKVEQVEAARTMKQAAAAYDRGDTAAAQGYVRQQKQKTAARAAEYNLPAAATAPILGGLSQMDDQMGAFAPSSAEGKAMTKGSKADARTMMK
jgi:Ca-activated chloride channel family protein